jgi:hypothetical protein
MQWQRGDEGLTGTKTTAQGGVTRSKTLWIWGTVDNMGKVSADQVELLRILKALWLSFGEFAAETAGRVRLFCQPQDQPGHQY